MGPTRTRPIRVPDGLWTAYGLVCAALGTSRAEALNAHMRRQVTEHGAPEALEMLDQADTEMAERRSRRGGRPRKDAGNGDVDEA